MNIALTKLYPFVNQVLTSSHHGFHTGLSTAFNLATFNNFIMEIINNKLQTDTVYTKFLNFSKAFDKVNHK